MTETWFHAPAVPPSAEFEAKARQRQTQLTKPLGALGRVEDVAIALASLQRTERPRAARVPVVLFAGDHGVVAEGVSAFPAAVTVEMLRNFSTGGAAISVLAREQGLDLWVVDAGSLLDGEMAGVVCDKPRRGTQNFAVARAMSGDEVRFALGAGARALSRAAAGGADLVIFGEMGIGNTTSAAAVAAAMLALDPGLIVGLGTGVDAAGLARKSAVIETAFRLHGFGRAPADPIDGLEAVGGFEIAALAGGMIGAAQAGVPILVDGFIVSVAALAAARINPTVRPWMLFSHRSAERGHALVLEALAAAPLLDFNMRLGEGSGAAMALPVLRLACALHNDMATFAEAAVSGKSAS